MVGQCNILSQRNQAARCILQGEAVHGAVGLQYVTGFCILPQAEHPKSPGDIVALADIVMALPHIRAGLKESEAADKRARYDSIRPFECVDLSIDKKNSKIMQNARGCPTASPRPPT